MSLIHPTRTQRIARLLILLLTRVLTTTLTRWQIRGRENMPKEGPLLVVVNHLTGYDQYFLSVSLSRKIMFMAKEELFRSRVVRLLAQAFGAFPVRRAEMDRSALRQANQVLDSGLALAMFPEGTRSKNGQLQPAFPGSALMALHNNAPILPVAITGLEASEKGIWWCFLHRPRVTVNIGRPFYLPAVGDKLTKTKLSELADYIMEHIAELLPPEYQGYYARRGD